MGQTSNTVRTVKNHKIILFKSELRILKFKLYYITVVIL